VGAEKKIRQRPTLPRGLPRSTIGSGGLNFRVRDGNGCDPSDIATGKSLGAHTKENRIQFRELCLVSTAQERVCSALPILGRGLDLDLELHAPGRKARVIETKVK
jgi:hypothetical protein